MKLERPPGSSEQPQGLGVGPPFAALIERNHMHYLYLSLAIVTELMGTTLLKVSDGFANRLAAVGMLFAYAFSFFFLSLSLRAIPVGVAYAVWSGIGIVVISVIGWLAFDQRLSFPAIAGMGLIVVGVVVLQLATVESV